MQSYEITSIDGQPALHLRTATRAGLVTGAIQGVQELTVPQFADTDAMAEEREVAVSGKDFTELFHRLLNEVLNLGRANGETYEGIKLSLITETEARGALLAKKVKGLGKELTGAALSGGAVAKNDSNQWDVTVVFAEE